MHLQSKSSNLYLCTIFTSAQLTSALLSTRISALLLNILTLTKFFNNGTEYVQVTLSFMLLSLTGLSSECTLFKVAAVAATSFVPRSQRIALFLIEFEHALTVFKDNMPVLLSVFVHRALLVRFTVCPFFSSSYMFKVLVCVLLRGFLQFLDLQPFKWQLKQIMFASGLPLIFYLYL